MKVIWESADIRTGLRVGIKGSSERWVVGYLSCPQSGGCFVVISEADYNVSAGKTSLEMAKCFTENDYLPTELI